MIKKSEKGDFNYLEYTVYEILVQISSVLFNAILCMNFNLSYQMSHFPCKKWKLMCFAHSE